MIDLVFIALFQAVAGAPAEAPTGEAAPAEAAAPEAAPQDPRDRIRCRSVASTGSRIATTRVCMSQNDEERLRERTQHEMREARSRSITGTQENALPAPR